jgi:hypothetical protein
MARAEPFGQHSCPARLKIVLRLPYTILPVFRNGRTPALHLNGSACIVEQKRIRHVGEMLQNKEAA